MQDLSRQLLSCTNRGCSWNCYQLNREGQGGGKELNVEEPLCWNLSNNKIIEFNYCKHSSINGDWREGPKGGEKTRRRGGTDGPQMKVGDI